MNTPLKVVLALAAVLCVAGIGYAAANPTASPASQSRLGPFAIFKLCKDDTMTIAQCKELVKQKIQDGLGQLYQKCLSKRTQSFCDQKKANVESRIASWSSTNSTAPQSGA